MNNNKDKIEIALNTDLDTKDLELKHHSMGLADILNESVKVTSNAEINSSLDKAINKFNKELSAKEKESIEQERDI